MQQTHPENGHNGNDTGLAWLHGTLYVGVMAARHLPQHKNLSIRHKVPSTLDACLGGVEKAACSVRPSKAYCCVNVGPTRRYEAAASCRSLSRKSSARSRDVTAEQGQMFWATPMTLTGKSSLKFWLQMRSRIYPSP